MTSNDGYSDHIKDDKERDHALDAPLQLDAGRGKDTGTPRLRETIWIVSSDADATDGLQGSRKKTSAARLLPTTQGSDNLFLKGQLNRCPFFMSAFYVR